jgi:WD40 repeat protein
MQAELTSILKRCLVEYGLSICQDRPRLKQWLEREMAACDREVHLLLSALDYGVVTTLLLHPEALPLAVLEHQVALLEEKLGLAPRYARWAVTTWAHALGKAVVDLAEVPPEAEKPLALVQTWQEHIAPVYGLAFNQSGQTLASGAWDGTIKLWQWAEYTSWRTLLAHDKGINRLLFDHRGQGLLSVGNDKRLKHWQIFQGNLLAEMRDAHNGVIWALALHPNGDFVATAGADAVIKLWQLPNLELVKTLTFHSAGVRVLAFSDDGRFLASGDRQGVIQLWTGFTGQPIATLHGHTACVQGLQFSLDNQMLYSAGEDGLLKCFSISARQEQASWFGHDQAIMALLRLPAADILISSDARHCLKFWQGSRLLLQQDLAVTALACHPSEPLLALGNAVGEVSLWQLNFLSAGASDA